MTERHFATFLRRSLALLERESTSAYQGVCSKLDGRVVRIQVDDERLGLEARGHKLHVGPARPNAHADAQASRSTLRGLLDGQRSLTDAVFAGDVMMRGGLSDLVALHDALLSYFRGAVRSPSFNALLIEFMTSAPPPAERPARTSKDSP